MNLNRVHHIDFVTHDLTAAVERFERALGVGFQPVEHLRERDVQVARVQIGETWLALVQPIGPSGPVRRFLDERGEGFYHIAFEVPDVNAVAKELDNKGVRLATPSPRNGLDGWKLLDVLDRETCGVMVQFVEVGNSESATPASEPVAGS